MQTAQVVYKSYIVEKKSKRAVGSKRAKLKSCTQILRFRKSQECFWQQKMQTTQVVYKSYIVEKNPRGLLVAKEPN